MAEQIRINFYLTGKSTPFQDTVDSVEGAIIEDAEDVLHDIGKGIGEILGTYDNFNDALVSEFPYMENRGQSVKIVCTDKAGNNFNLFYKLANKDGKNHYDPADFYITYPRWGVEAEENEEFVKKYFKTPRNAHLRGFDIKTNKYQYYTMKAPQDATDTATVDYGRLGGSDGSRSYMRDGTPIYEDTVDFPAGMFWIKYFEKLAKGYKDFTEEYVFDKSTLPVKKPQDLAEYEEIQDKKVNSTIYQLITHQRKYVEQRYKMDIPVNESAIRKSKNILGQMAKVVSDKRLKDDTRLEKFTALYTDLLLTLPRKVSNINKYVNRVNFNDENSETYIDKVMESEQELLDSFISVYEDDKTHGNRKGTVLDANNITMRIADFEDKWFVLDQMNHRESYGNYGYTAVKIFAVENKAQTKRFKQTLNDLGIRRGSVKALWHGSRTENWWSILKNSLMINADAITTGKMFGNGPYFAWSYGKSHNYCDVKGVRWATGSNANVGYIALFDVALGKEYRVTSALDWDFSYNDLRNGCHSVHALSKRKDQSSYLQNDEYVVYNEGQCNIRYLVEFDDSRHQDYTFRRRTVSDNAKISFDGIDKNTGRIRLVSDNMNELCDKAEKGPVVFTYSPEKPDEYTIEGIYAHKAEREFLADVFMHQFAKNEYEFKDFAQKMIMENNEPGLTL